MTTATQSPGGMAIYNQNGQYLQKNPATGQPVADQSRQYIVAVPEKSVDLVRDLLKSACRVFAQTHRGQPAG